MYGSHLSIAGGLHKALLEAEKLRMDTVQVFSKNQQQWAAKPLAEEDIRLWKEHVKRLGFSKTVCHDSYLINLASPDPALWDKSLAAIIDEVKRCDLLEIPYLVMHPGAHLDSGEEAGLARVAMAMDRVHQDLPKSTTTVCLEITAGQGSSLGYKLEHLATIIEATKHSDRLGVCLDTAHLFAAGYDLRGAKYDAFRKELGKTIGIKTVKAWHLNDSKKALGSRVDRHDHIGEGLIGLEGFRGIVRDDAWAHVPKILETPKEKAKDGRDWDEVNMERLKGLA